MFLSFSSLPFRFHLSLACVADALNLLYIDGLYKGLRRVRGPAANTKGLDECVGRLQRRLSFPFSPETPDTQAKNMAEVTA